MCRLAVDRNFMDAGPIRGMRIGGVDEEMQVRVAVAGQQVCFQRSIKQPVAIIRRYRIVQTEGTRKSL